MSNPSINREKWSVIRFDQIAECLTVRVEPSETTLERYVGLEHLDPETLKISRWGTPSDVIGEKLHFWPGDIIFGKRRAYQKKLAVADFEGICSAHAMVLRARPEIVLPEFLPFFMQSDMFFERALSISVGSLSPTINWGTLAKQEFPLPPLDEQRRIAQILWAADEVTVNWSVYLLRSESAKWRLFDQLFWKKNKADNLALPDNWKLLPLSKCVHERGETSKHPHKRERYLGLENIEPGSWTTSTFSDSSNFSSNCSVFHTGDLLYGKLRPNLDKAAIASFEGVCTTEILVLCNETFITNDFLLCHFHSPRFVEFNSHQAFGTKMPRTSFEIFGNYQIPVPPLEEQREILETFHSLISTESEVKNHINMSRKLSSNLINKLLSV
jgi:restriction endonuclease S subunit